ncbi:MAG: hypothetical protein ACI8WP_001544 [Flavobacteriaceae bacterium]|jgi:hypothetical protein
MTKYFVSIIFLLVHMMGTTQQVINTSKKGLGVDGHDLVSYFENKPSLGVEKFSIVLDQVNYLFLDEKNLSLFKKSPDKYLPQYGGWCAYAMGLNGDLVEVDPMTYTITAGKLYLFYNKRGNNTLLPWKEDESMFLIKADNHWSSKSESD